MIASTPPGTRAVRPGIRDDRSDEAPRAVVVGGGMAGLAAARTLARADIHVTLIEASDQVGGCIRTVDFRGLALDVGAEALHTADPASRSLLAELGLSDQVVEARRTGTWIAAPSGLRRLPDGVGPAGPTRIGPLVSCGLLGPTGLARAALEPFIPRTRLAADAAVGEVLGRRFGGQVVARIIDPLLGGLHAGDVHRLSVRAATPQLAALLEEHRSVILAARRQGSRRQAGFVTLSTGLQTLPAALAAQLAGRVITGAGATAIIDTSRAGRRYRVETDTGEHHEADAVVVAVPPTPAAAVLAGLDPHLPGLLAPFRAASVAVVLLAYPGDVRRLPALEGTGMLVPSGHPGLLKAATFLTSKWPHHASPEVVIRASTGRDGDERHLELSDDALIDQIDQQLRAMIGLPAPLQAAVVRWHDAMPQLTVGHLQRVAAARDRLARHPRIQLAGAAYDGVGVTSAFRSGTAAARAVLASPMQRTS